jgi:hypothetical protein
MAKRNKNRAVAERGLMNKHQRKAFRAGELRVGREQIEELLQMSRSPDAEERFEAASYLCPCHVRRRIDEVWEALYRMLEDDDIKVRRAAWHTLEDGGKPDDPALDVIIERTLGRETDRQVLNFARLFAKGRKCDFCAAANVPVKKDFATELETSGQRRFAMVCEPCDRTL